MFWSKSSHHWSSEARLTGAPGGGSQAHSPVDRLANMCSLVRGSTISTHSTAAAVEAEGEDGEGGAAAAGAALMAAAVLRRPPPPRSPPEALMAPVWVGRRPQHEARSRPWRPNDSSALVTASCPPAASCAWVLPLLALGRGTQAGGLAQSIGKWSGAPFWARL